MQVGRVASVIAGLIAAGAVVGAAAGVITGAIIVALWDGPLGIFSAGEVYSFAASVGGTCGALLAPVASFAFMRHVPLWRLFTETAIGTVIGGVIGLTLLNVGFGQVLGLATAGFLAAGARLALEYRNKRPLAELPPVA